MARKIGDALIEVRPDTKRFAGDAKRDLDVAGRAAGDSLGRELNDGLARAVKRRGGGIELVGQVLSTRLAKAGAVAGGKLALNLASELGSKLPGSFAKLGPAGGVLAAVVGASAAPLLGAALSGAVLGGAGAGGIVGGFLLASKDPAVAAASARLKARIGEQLEEAAAPFVPGALRSIAKVEARFDRIGPHLESIFRDSEGFLDPLVDGALDGGERVVEGLRDAVAGAGPVMNELGGAFEIIGDAVGDALTTLSDNGPGAAGAIRAVAEGIGSGIRVGAQFIDFLTAAFEKSVAFADGSLQVADAVSFGLNPAIGAAREKVDSIKAAMDRAREGADDAGGGTDRYAGAAHRARAAADAQRAAMTALDTAVGAVSGEMQFATTQADALRRASENLFGAEINLTEAQEARAASLDGLTDSVKANKGSLDINSAAGRANRDSLQSVLQKTNELYFAEIATGTSIEQATKKHGNRIAALKEEAKRLGLNKVETDKLIKTYGNIPTSKTTKLEITGMKAVENALTDLLVAQQALARGITVEQADASYRNKTQRFFSAGRLAGGGPVRGPGTGTSDSVPIWASNNEHMWTAAEVRAAGGHASMLELRKAALSGAFKFAGGGPVFPRDIRMPVTAAKTQIMTLDEARSRVTPDAPSGGQTLDFMVRVLKQAFPGLGLISGYRPGSRTLSGSLSYHGFKRAVDYPPNIEMARWVNANYKARTKEFISPYQQYNIHNGQRHTYTGAVWNQHNFAGGNAHNHWAMDSGGYLRPGWNPPIFNGTGRPEPVTPAATVDETNRLLRRMIALMEKAPAESGKVFGEVLNGIQRGVTARSRAMAPINPASGRYGRI